MTRKELVQFIREQLIQLTVEEIKKSKSSPVPQKKDAVMSEEELDNILFFGGETPNYEKNPITIKESQENKVKITTSEIRTFEDEFKKQVSPLVSFDKQHNGHSLYLYKGPKGLEAKASGIIKINATNEVKWFFSIQEGARITANLKLDEDNYDLITKLYQFFDTWQQDWSNKLSGSDQNTETDEASPALPTGGPTGPAVTPSSIPGA